MESLVRINDFETVEGIFNLIGSSIDLQSHQPLCNSLLDLIEWMIHPVYCKFASPRRHF